MNKQIIGFIGTGVMGKSMAAHLLKAGYTVHIYNRSKEKAKELITEGAIWHDSVSEVAQVADVIITIVGYPRDVEDIYLKEDGIIAKAKKGSYVVDMTTSSPKLAEKIYEKAKEKEIFALDAPVSGGDIGAKNGTLTIMVGGDERAFNELLPIFNVMGKNIVYQGRSGAGQHTKMSNQIAIAANMLGVAEALSYAVKAGLDPEKVLASIGAGAAGSWSLNNLAPRMLKGDFAPGFYIKHFLKDMEIALNSAKELGLNTPALSLAKIIYEDLKAKGEEDSGTQAIFKWYIN